MKEKIAEILNESMDCGLIEECEKYLATNEGCNECKTDRILSEIVKEIEGVEVPLGYEDSSWPWIQGNEAMKTRILTKLGE